MLQQYILGALKPQSMHSKYPVAVLRIDAPADQVDFNRDMNKAKVFLMHRVN